MNLPPMQPMVPEPDRGGRFKANILVDYLLECASKGEKCDLNDLARIEAPPEDREQFAMLIGYSLSGFLELSYVRDRTAEQAIFEATKQGLIDPKKRFWWQR